MSQRPRRRGSWSVQELERLRLLLPHRGVDPTAALLRRSPDSVRRKALELLRVPERQGAWTASDDEQLRLAWGALEPQLLGPLLGRASGEVRRRADELRSAPRTGPWSRQERQLLKRLYGTRRDADLEVCMLRRRDEILAVARELCLAKDKRFRAAVAPATGGGRSSMPRWTDDEVERLRELYPDRDNLAVARELGRTVTSVANKAYQLGLKKSPQLLATIGRANIAQRYAAAGADSAPGGLADGV